MNAIKTMYYTSFGQAMLPKKVLHSFQMSASSLMAASTAMPQVMVGTGGVSSRALAALADAFFDEWVAAENPDYYAALSDLYIDLDGHSLLSESRTVSAIMRTEVTRWGTWSNANYKLPSVLYWSAKQHVLSLCACLCSFLPTAVPQLQTSTGVVTKEAASARPIVPGRPLQKVAAILSAGKKAPGRGGIEVATGGKSTTFNNHKFSLLRLRSCIWVPRSGEQR